MNKFSPVEMARHGAKYYNASSQHEQERWFENALNGYIQLKVDASSNLNKARKNFYKLERFLIRTLHVFNHEMDSIGIGHHDLIRCMQMVYSAETSFGTNNVTSSTGVVGALQVTTATFRDLVTQGILGNKAAQALGYSSKATLSRLTDTEVRELLKTDAGSFLAGTAKFIQTLY